MTNFYDLVLFSLFSGLAAGLISLIKDIITFILFNTDTTEDNAYTSVLGSIISEHGWCSGKCIQSRNETPSDGWHYLHKYRVFVNKKSGCGGGYRQSEPSDSYTIVGFRWNKRHLENDIKKICEGDFCKKQQIPNIYVETVPCPWNISQRIMYHDTLDSCKWTRDQRTVTKMVVTQYMDFTRASVIVGGKPKTGKSTLATTIATYLLNEHGIKATIIHGMNPNNPVSMSFINKKPTRMNPHIYLINEVETAVDQAYREKKEMRDTNTYADNKSSLCDYMDRCATCYNVIRIYTTNETSIVTDINKDVSTNRNLFFRNGRVDFAYEMTETIEDQNHTFTKHSMTLRKRK